MKNDSILRQLWGPVALSMAIVTGGLMGAGSYLESLRATPSAPKRPLPISESREVWDRIQLPPPQRLNLSDRKMNVAQTPVLEIMTPGTVEDISQSTLQAHQTEQRLSRRNVAVAHEPGLTASIRETTNYLQQHGAKCATIFSAYTPDAGNPAQGSYVGLRLLFDKASNGIFVSNVRPTLSDHDVMMQFPTMPNQIKTARERIMTQKESYTVSYFGSTNSETCVGLLAMPHPPRVS